MISGVFQSVHFFPLGQGGQEIPCTQALGFNRSCDFCALPGEPPAGKAADKLFPRHPVLLRSMQPKPWQYNGAIQPHPSHPPFGIAPGRRRFLPSPAPSVPLRPVRSEWGSAVRPTHTSLAGRSRPSTTRKCSAVLLAMPRQAMGRRPVASPAEVPETRPSRAGGRKAGGGEHLPGHPEALQAGTSPRLLEGRQAGKQRNRSSQLASSAGFSAYLPAGAGCACFAPGGPDASARLQVAQARRRGPVASLWQGPGEPLDSLASLSGWKSGKKWRAGQLSGQSPPSLLLLLLLPPAGVQRGVCACMCFRTRAGGAHDSNPRER